MGTDKPAPVEPVDQPEKTKRAAKPAVVKPDRVKVIAKYPPFVDLIKDVRIGGEPVEVEMHPWLEAQIGVGLIIVVK